MRKYRQAREEMKNNFVFLRLVILPIKQIQNLSKYEIEIIETAKRSSIK